jgi:peptidoglycan/LPS O-acetylase OafA/YrhL
MSQSKREAQSRLLGIEGMRALAASSILVYHVWLYGAPNRMTVDLGWATKAFDNLRVGVTLFFVLSGFLLFRPFVASALRGKAGPSVRNYFANRALRIVPAYWVILLLVAILFQRQLLTAPTRLLANLFLAQDYVPSTIGTGIVPAWSLAIEAVFYLCVPVLGLVAIVLARRSGRPLLASSLPIALLVVVGVTAKVALHVFSLGPVWWWSFLTHADWFAPGMALAVVLVLWEDGRVRIPPWWQGCVLLAIAALTLTAVGLFYGGELSFLEYQSPLALACALLLSLVVFADPRSRLIRMLTVRPVVAAGLASYSLFLWHDPILRFLRDTGLTLSGQGGFLVNLLFLGAVSGLASAGTYQLVEKTALARRRTSQRSVQPPVTAEPLGSVEEADIHVATVRSAPAALE